MIKENHHKRQVHFAKMQTSSNRIVPNKGSNVENDS